MLRRVLLLLLGAVAPPVAGVHAQSPQLARIDSLVDRGRFTEARTSLRQWTVRNDASGRPDDVAYALLLRGRLHARADSALAAYLELAIGHPSSRHAPEALLRLAQGYTALGDTQRAAGYLERLARDYPAARVRPLALAWLDRIRPPAPRPPATTGNANTGSPNAAAGPGRYTIQVAAYRDRASAVALVRSLRNRDIPARIVIMPGSKLHLVRAGRFGTAREAEPLLRRVRALVPDAATAADAHREDAASR